jgi:hypothetical protein
MKRKSVLFLVLLCVDKWGGGEGGGGDRNISPIGLKLPMCQT